MTDRRVNAVVLAGGKASPELQAITGVANRALSPLNGRPMLDYVIAALTLARSVAGITVVGDVPASYGYNLVPDHGSMLDNLLAGIEKTSGESVLAITSDIPFLTSEAIDDFVARSSPEIDITYPIVNMESYRKRFNQLKRTTLKIREGEFTGGNMMMLRSAFISQKQEQVRQAYAARKNVLKLAAILGPGFLARVIISQTVAPSVLQLVSLEAGVARLLGPGSTVEAIITDYAEIGTDVDDPSEIKTAEALLGKQTIP